MYFSCSPAYSNDSTRVLSTEDFNIVTEDTLGILVSSSKTIYCPWEPVTVFARSNLPKGTSYILSLYRGSTAIKSMSSNDKIFTFLIPKNAINGDYHFEVTANGYNLRARSDDFIIKKPFDVKITNRYNESFDSSNEFCGDSGILLKGHALDSLGNKASGEIHFSWHAHTPTEELVSSGLGLDSIRATSRGHYLLVASSGYCSIESGLVSVRNVQTPTAQFYTGNTTACEGEPILLKSGNYHGEQGSYQWYKDNNPIEGATSKSYNAYASGYYQVKVTDPDCSQSTESISAARRLIFSPSLATNLSYYNDIDYTCGGSLVSIRNSLPDNPISPISFQWQRDGVDINDGSITNLVTNIPGKYRLRLTQGDCTSISNEVTLIETEKHKKPLIYTPYDTICSGYIYLTTISENGRLYDRPGQWYKDDNPIGSPYYDIKVTEPGTYKIAMGLGTPCEAWSDEVNLVYSNEFTPKILEYTDLSKYICGSLSKPLAFDDSDIQTTGYFSSEEYYNYQWKKDGISIPGATTRSYSATSPGHYQLEVSNANCYGISESYLVERNDNNSPVIQTKDADLYCNNRLTQIVATNLNTFGAYSGAFKWYKDGMLIPDEKENSIFVNEKGSYQVVFDLDGCVGTSNALTIQSGPPDDFIAELPSVIEMGDEVTIQITNCPGEVKWFDQKSEGNLIKSGVSIETPELNEKTSYWVSCSVEYCESDRIEVKIIPQNCDEDIHHTTNVDSYTYKTNQTITGEAKVNTGTVYQAGEAIILKPGFFVDKNKVFEARIGGCE